MSLDARPSVLFHATEELLEEYSFGRICEPQLGRLEEHLLICPACQSQLDEIDEYKIFMRAGLASFESERQTAARSVNPAAEPAPQVRRAEGRSALSRHFAFFRMPVTKHLLAAALLLVISGATMAWRTQSSTAMAPVATVKLMTLRGGDGSIARAPSGHPLTLVFDRRELVADLSYQAEVLDSSGRRVWSGTVRIEDQNLSIQVDRPLQAGVYWVRLYSSAGELLREFGLNVA